MLGSDKSISSICEWTNSQIKALVLFVNELLVLQLITQSNNSNDKSGLICNENVGVANCTKKSLD